MRELQLLLKVPLAGSARQQVRTAQDLVHSLARIVDGLARGLTAAGLFSYELGYLFEPRLAPLLPADRQHPLLWVGLFQDGQALDEAGVCAHLAGHVTGEHRVNGRRRAPSRGLSRPTLVTSETTMYGSTVICSSPT